MVIQSSDVHWTKTRERLAAVLQRIEESWAPAPEESARVLETRAKALAREPEIHNASADQIEVIEFLLAYERYGIATAYVREIYPLVELTPLPGAPSFVLGIVNVRGEIVSVVDLKRFFDLPEKGLTNLNQLIVVRNSDMELGILADEVLGVTTIGLDGLQPPLPTMTGIRAEYLLGITDDRMAILDIENILGDRKIVVGK